MTITPHFIDLLRHGQPSGGDRFRGVQDDPLSETGWQQMRKSVDGMAPWDVVVTSPLRRCAEFASELSGRHGLTVETEPRLAELSFGEWEGRSYQEVKQAEPAAWQAFFDDPVNSTPPGGEKMLDFCERIDFAWDDLVERHKGGHVLVVCHGAVMRVICRRILKMPMNSLFSIEVPYACLTRIRRHHDGDRLVFHRSPDMT